MSTHTDTADKWLNDLPYIGVVDMPLVELLKSIAAQLDAQVAAGDVKATLATEYRRTMNEIKEFKPETDGEDEDDDFLSPQDA